MADRHKRHRDERRERSRSPARRSNHHNFKKRDRRDRTSNNETNIKWGRQDDNDEDEKKVPVKKQEPTLEPSGILTQEANTFHGVVVKYAEPPEARKPSIHWRLYPFKGDTVLPVLHMHRQSGYLIGREKKVCDIRLDHPSISKQHAVFQFRQVEDKDFNNKRHTSVNPYIIDLDSANGTFLNGEKIESRRYVELREKDVVKFGFSSREYVLLTDSSDDV